MFQQNIFQFIMMKITVNMMLMQNCEYQLEKLSLSRSFLNFDTPQLLKNGQADYYFGSCQTGAGGALGMAIAMNGMDKCITVAMVGKVLDDDEILKSIENGKKAFGFVPEAAASVIPVIMRGIMG